VLYGLGQLFESLWVLFIGRLVQGFWSGGCGPALAQHAVYACVGKRKRTEWTATIGNLQFLGMGVGPLLAAVLAKVSFTIGLLQVDEYTNPGWSFATFWLILAIALLFIEEPRRPFEKALERQKSERASESHERMLPNMKIVWCLFGIGVCSAAMAAWETGAAVITQKYFGYDIMLSSVVIGVGFLTCTLGGHVVNFLIARYQLREADVVAVGMAMILLCSALLYWYLPTRVADERRIANEISYMIGSVLVLNAANFTRNYCVAICLREAATVSSQMKDMAVSAQAFAMQISRALGALFGMGVASLPGGANYAAAIVTGISAFMLMFLSAPGLFAGLRRV
jgi:MFS family permease